MLRYLLFDAHRPDARLLRSSSTRAGSRPRRGRCLQGRRCSRRDRPRRLQDRKARGRHGFYRRSAVDQGGRAVPDLQRRARQLHLPLEPRRYRGVGVPGKRLCRRPRGRRRPERPQYGRPGPHPRLRACQPPHLASGRRRMDHGNRQLPGEKTQQPQRSCLASERRALFHRSALRSRQARRRPCAGVGLQWNLPPRLRRRRP